MLAVFKALDSDETCGSFASFNFSFTAKEDAWKPLMMDSTTPATSDTHELSGAHAEVPPPAIGLGTEGTAWESRMRHRRLKVCLSHAFDFCSFILCLYY